MIGVDLVGIGRIKRAYERRGVAFLERFLSKKEIAMAGGSIQSIAGFWATKEAVSKALGCGIGDRLSFKDIKIKKTCKNKPYVILSKPARKIHGLKRIEVSITHDKDLAIAVAVF